MVRLKCNHWFSLKSVINLYTCMSQKKQLRKKSPNKLSSTHEPNRVNSQNFEQHMWLILYKVILVLIIVRKGRWRLSPNKFDVRHSTLAFYPYYIFIYYLQKSCTVYVIYFISPLLSIPLSFGKTKKYIFEFSFLYSWCNILEERKSKTYAWTLGTHSLPHSSIQLDILRKTRTFHNELETERFEKKLNVVHFFVGAADRQKERQREKRKKRRTC